LSSAKIRATFLVLDSNKHKLTKSNRIQKAFSIKVHACENIGVAEINATCYCQVPQMYHNPFTVFALLPGVESFLITAKVTEQIRIWRVRFQIHIV
jgi:hypothetical protein